MAVLVFMGFFHQRFDLMGDAVLAEVMTEAMSQRALACGRVVVLDENELYIYNLPYFSIYYINYHNYFNHKLFEYTIFYRSPTFYQLVERIESCGYHQNFRAFSRKHEWRVKSDFLESQRSRLDSRPAVVSNMLARLSR